MIYVGCSIEKYNMYLIKIYSLLKFIELSWSPYSNAINTIALHT